MRIMPFIIQSTVTRKAFKIGFRRCKCSLNVLYPMFSYKNFGRTFTFKIYKTKII